MGWDYDGHLACPCHHLTAAENCFFLNEKWFIYAGKKYYFPGFIYFFDAAIIHMRMQYPAL